MLWNIPSPVSKEKENRKKIQVDYANGIKRFHPTLFDFNHHISIVDGQAQFRKPEEPFCFSLSPKAYFT